MQSAVKHGLMGKNRGEALVVELDGDVRLRFSPTVDKLLHTLHVFAGLSVHLAWLAYDDTLYRFALNVLNKPIV